MSDEQDDRKVKERGFRVIDRRGRAGEEATASEDEPRSGGAQPSVDPSGGARAPASGAADTTSGRSADPSGASHGEGPLPTVDFSTLILSLSHSALYHLGLVEDPETGEATERNLPAAQQTIDMLDVLQRKTRGNLEADENRLLESLLYELRMRFVEAQK